MKKVLLSCVAIAAGSAMAMAQALPEYPDKLDFTLNGEKELKGVSVSQTMKSSSGIDYLTIEISGESAADEITMDFKTPAGWDYALIDTPTDGENSPFMTRSGESDHWFPVKDVISMGYKKGSAFKFPVNGKKNLATIYLVKDENVWEYSIDISFKVKKAEGGDDPVVDTPEFPDHLDYTLNGEKELPGITVRQGTTGDTHIFSVTGKCDSDYISVTFETPAGWDGLMISDSWGEGEISTVKTRSVELIPVNDILGQGFKDGNTITYKTDGEAQWGYIALIKGDQACMTFVNFDITVSKSEGGDEPGEDPAFPESFIVDTFNEGLEVTQDYKWGCHNINVKGEVFADKFSVVIDVPEGWDGFVCYNWSHEGEVTITENDPMPKATRAEEELEWISVEKLLAKGYVKGNRFTFEPTFIPANNNFQTIELHLYKGDMAIKDDILALLVYVSKAEGPVFPESFEVSVNPQGLNVTKGDDYGVYTINVEGECTEDEVEVTLAVPEGWDGFLGMTDSDFEDSEAQPLKKVQGSEWEPITNLLELGFKETNTLKFKADGEQHEGALYLYKSGLVDGANYIAVYSKVTKSEGEGVDSVESTGVARFFNLQGAEVANPEPGIYVKKENGKTTKVVVK